MLNALYYNNLNKTYKKNINSFIPFILMNTRNLNFRNYNPF